MTTVSKTCNRCKQSKPLSEFYTRSGMPKDDSPTHYITECKACMKERSKERAKRPKTQESLVASENLAINELKRNCIYAQTGRSANAPHVDVVCWGLVQCEIKRSGLSGRYGSNPSFYFSTTTRQRRLGFRAHVVIFICEWPNDETTYHVLPADHPDFENGDRLRANITYSPYWIEGSRGRKPLITRAMMDAAQNNWQLIEETRLRVAAALPYDAKPIMQLVNNPTVKLVPMTA